MAYNAAIQLRFHQRHIVARRAAALARYHKKKEDIARIRKAKNQLLPAKEAHKLAERKRRISKADHIRAVDRRRYADNPEPKRFASSKRWARQHSAKGSHTEAQWLARVEYYGWHCVLQVSPRCLFILTLETLTKEHRVPLSKGGTDWAANLVPACGFCNSTKGSKWPTQKK